MLAFYETVRSGLVPLKVVKVARDEDGQIQITGKVTAARGPYKRGEIIEGGVVHMIPRTAVYKPRGAFFPRILPYSWAEHVA